jgi:hypothetical protein
VRNTGQAPLILDPCHLTNLTGGATFVTADDCGVDTIAWDGTADYTVSAGNATPRVYRAAWAIHSPKYGSGCGNVTVDSMTLTLNVVDRQAPEVLGWNSPGSDALRAARFGSVDTLVVRVQDNVEVKAAQVQVRHLNAPDSKVDSTINGTLTGNDPGTHVSTYRANVGGVFTVETGYEYRLIARDQRPNVDTTDWFRREVRFETGAIARPNDAVHGEVKLNGQWYMIAAPGLLDAASADTVLGIGAHLSQYGTDTWQLYPAHRAGEPVNAYGASQAVFVPPGSAAWFRHIPKTRTDKNDSLLVWHLPGGWVSPSTGSSIDSFRITLSESGWNMFSNPFFFDVYLPVNSGTMTPLLTTALLRGSPNGYSNKGDVIGVSSNRSEMTYLSDSSSLQVYAVLHPWVGYAIRSAGLKTLALSAHPPNDPGNWENLPSVAPRGWGVTIAMSSGSQRLGDVLCGFAQTAKNEWDPLDWPLFPVPRAAGVLYVAHDDWGKLSDKYVVDVRAAASGGAIYQLGWRTSQSGGEMCLTVSALDDLPVGATAVLYDRAADKRIELSTGTSYTFRSELSRDDNRFVVLIGDASFTEQWAKQEQSARPVTYRLAPNYPNPFNAGTVIGFTLPQYTHVSLEVFNILGQQVRTLVDHPMYPGVHQIEFDATDNVGRGLAAGVYFYRLRTELGTQTRKMVLLK